MRRLAGVMVWVAAATWMPASRAATEYSVADGLSQNSVLSLARDDDGFVWLGTEDGLNRFDGYEFRVFRPGNGRDSDPKTTYVRAIQAQGRHLFLATNGSGLAIFDRHTQRFRMLGLADGLPGEHLKALALIGPQTLYVASRNGLARIDWEGDPMVAPMRVSVLAVGADPPREDIWELASGASGLWVGTGDGVFRIDAKGRATQLDVEGAVRPFNTDALLEAPAGVLWVGSWDMGLFRIELASGATRRFQAGASAAPGLRTDRILSLAAGPSGIVFIGTDRGLAWFDPACNCVKALDHARSARVAGRGFLAVSLLVDPHGGLFAGYWGEGLARFTPTDRSFHLERPREDGPAGLNHNRVRTVLEDRVGRLWVGTFGGGVQRVAADRRQLGLPWSFESLPFPRQAPDLARHVWYLLQDRAGRIWAATDDGVYWTNADTVDWHRERPYGEDVPMPGARVLHEDSGGRLWVGSSAGLGVIERVGSARRHVPLADADEPWYTSQDEQVHALHLDSEQRVWVGTVAGLHLLDAEGRRLARYRVADGLPGPIVWGIHRHPDGSLWLATSGGLARVDESAGVTGLRFEDVGRRHDLPQGAVFAAIGDREGQLWLTGNRGLIRFDPVSGRHRVWKRSEGIASDESAANAMAAGADGWLYFGGVDGITAFDPLALQVGLERPRPMLARAERDGQPLGLAAASGQPAPLRLRHDHAPLILDVTGLAFDAPRELRYRYRLDPEAPFTELGSRRSLILDRLPYGRHALELEVDNRGNVARRQLLAIEVVPPLRATWGFRTGAALLAMLLLSLLYLWRVRALTRQRHRLASLVNERTRELRAQKEALEATAEALVAANDKLRSLSVIDALTGLPNRRGLIERVEAALAETREGGPGLALIDLDHFKRVNDAFGHQAGDAVLRDFAALVGEYARPGVVVGRWGGEEFLALLPLSDAAALQRWAEHLIKQVSGRKVAHAGRTIDYRISVGATLVHAGESMDGAVARADDALYAAKAQGRDRLVLAA